MHNYVTRFLKIKSYSIHIHCWCMSFRYSGIAVHMSDGLYIAPSLSSEVIDAVFPQNLPSIVVSHVLDPQPGNTVLDMCAAPGL